MDYLLETDDLSFQYPRTQRPVLTDINLRMRHGELVGIVGRSGCGKTTLLRCLCGAIPHAYPGTLAGQVLIARKPAVRLRLPEIAATIGYVFQEPETQLFCTSVEEEIAFGPRNLCLPPDQVAARVARLMARFGLTHLNASDPLSLSGGEKQRVAIAAVLAMRPRVLLLDEPTAHLDSAGREALEESLAEHRADGGAVVIAATDELSCQVPLSRTCVLSAGHLQEQSAPGGDQ
ncbi:MAG: ATP-binding cassette domain-containing protein [Chitinivibrionales bacterium]|nr:ATP-binding cassette domain-containing protein [Chitinivibrionales bacterium]